MKLTTIISLFVLLIKPISIRAIPVKGISDFDGGFQGIETIDFECPPNDEIKILKPNEELDDQQSTKTCWVDFHPTYLNVMGKQVIKRNNVISFFQSPPASGKCCASWNLIYRDNAGKSKILSMRKKEFPFPLTKRKLKILGIPSNIINRWRAQ